MQIKTQNLPILIILLSAMQNQISRPESLFSLASRRNSPTSPSVQNRSLPHKLLQENYDNIEQKVEDINEQIAELEKKKQTLIDQHPKLD